MKFEDKLRALVAGMRYAADMNDGYAVDSITPEARENLRGRASAMRSDAAALEAILNAHAAVEVTRAAR